MIKICIWMDGPSHHQKAFFEALSRHPDIDLQIRYYLPGSPRRQLEGWQPVPLGDYEKVLPQNFRPENMMESWLPDWQERIHILALRTRPAVSGFLRKNKVRWCQWSERGGYIVARITGFRLPLYRLMMPWYLRLWKRREGKIIDREAMAAFCPGKLSRDYFRKIGIREEKLFDLYYACNTPAVSAPDQDIRAAANGRRVFLYLGGVEKGKGIDILLRAFARLHSRDWCLVLCGKDKSDGKYAQWVASRHLNDSVFFAGVRPSNRIGAVYAAADVVVFPTLYDGWGMILQEAAAMGVPLIGSDMASSTHEVIRNGLNGFTVRAGSVSSLEEAMRRYIADPSLLKTHGEASRELYLRKMTPEANAQRLYEALQKSIGS